ncbi:putative immunity protein [Deltaproteobacteria bacterium TL4]
MLHLDQHRQLAIWAADCAEHVLAVFEKCHPLDNRPRYAIETARAWACGTVSVGTARKASSAAHAAARDATNVAAREAARAAGHAVATAHMADHSLGPAWYAVRAVRALAGVAAAEQERAWQLKQLEPSIRELVISTLKTPKFAG